MIEVCTEIKIEAPPERVWKILTDFERYPEWNPFVREVHGNLREGAKLQVYLGSPGQPGMKFKPVVTKVEPQKAFHWLGRFLIPGLMDGEHIFEIEPIGKYATRFIHGEEYRGLLVRLFGKMVPDDSGRNYIVMNEALKKRAEENI